VNYSQPTPPYTTRGRKHLFNPAKSRLDPLQGMIVLGRYRINSKVADGGMSTVYLARNFEKGGLFAVKVLRADLVRDVTIRERILNEFRAIQRIDHPAVVKILEAGKVGEGQICLVMEYIHGSPLRRLLQSGPLKLTKVIPVVAAVAEGLHAAHQQQIIHRDLKPENVLLPRGSETRTVVKLIDFGIARILDAPRITTTHHIMGTPEYIAPEQAMGSPIDHRSDIYSLGVMMYEMLAGALPFQEEDPDILLHHHVHTPPPKLRQRKREGERVPASIEKLIVACMEKNPNDRPHDMGEVLREISL
jgi:eukaryotic-like serine/threonine-protein kinase